MKNLSHYLLEHLDGHEIQEELSLIISDIASAGKKISHEVQRSGLLDLHGASGGQNIHDEEVQKLDEHSNSIVKDMLAENEYVIGLASEEEDDVVDVSDGKKSGYLVAFDPLDGSSNIDTNMPIGTIFSVLPSSGDIAKDFLQPAGKQVSAGYVLYGSSTVIVFSVGRGVHEFTLDPDSGEFVLTSENIKMPENTGYISYNPYVLPNMAPKRAEAYRQLVAQTGRSMRYVGAMVADVHRTLMKGGFFAYPAVGKDGNYKGKLRMQYEAKPLGWLIEQAGGKALLNNKLVNEAQPTELHQKVSVELGDVGTMKLFQSLAD
ncbi:MAG TPA: class 1 fructose-bisphosphatase [Patescibacteria group bacterium]|nr:class 1 fructose-bisphosphatase [Patescibacteria group bacterium]